MFPYCNIYWTFYVTGEPESKFLYGKQTTQLLHCKHMWNQKLPHLEKKKIKKLLYLKKKIPQIHLNINLESQSLSPASQTWVCWNYATSASMIMLDRQNLSHFSRRRSVKKQHPCQSDHRFATVHLCLHVHFHHLPAWPDKGASMKCLINVIVTTNRLPKYLPPPKKKNDKKSAGRGVIYQTFPPNPCMQGKSHYIPRDSSGVSWSSERAYAGNNINTWGMMMSASALEHMKSSWARSYCRVCWLCWRSYLMQS